MFITLPLPELPTLVAAPAQHFIVDHGACVMEAQAHGLHGLEREHRDGRDELVVTDLVHVALAELAALVAAEATQLARQEQHASVFEPTAAAQRRARVVATGEEFDDQHVLTIDEDGHATLVRVADPG